MQKQQNTSGTLSDMMNELDKAHINVIETNIKTTKRL